MRVNNFREDGREKTQHRRGVDCRSGRSDLRLVGCSASRRPTRDNRLEHKYVVTTDPDEVMKYWDSGDEVVLYDPMPPREFAGFEAIHDHMADFAANKDVKIDFLELQVISDGKLVLARSVQHYTAKGAGGKPIDTTYRSTDLWRKTHGQWKIINSHVSFPVDLKTGKADMASKM